MTQAQQQPRSTGGPIAAKHVAKEILNSIDGDGLRCIESETFTEWVVRKTYWMQHDVNFDTYIKTTADGIVFRIECSTKPEVRQEERVASNIKQVTESMRAFFGTAGSYLVRGKQ